MQLNFNVMSYYGCFSLTLLHCCTSKGFYLYACGCIGGAGGKGVWGAAGLVYEMEEPDCKDPNYDESAQVSGTHTCLAQFIKTMQLLCAHMHVCLCVGGHSVCHSGS